MSEKPSNGNGYVTYRQLFALVLTVTFFAVGALGSIGAFAWKVHSAQPHSGAVHQRELVPINSQLRSIEDKVDWLIMNRGNPNARYKFPPREDRRLSTVKTLRFRLEQRGVLYGAGCGGYDS